MTKKKLLALLVVSMLLMGLFAACQQQPAPATPAGGADASGGGAAPSVDGAGLRIGLSMAERDPWLSFLEQAAIDRANELGVALTVFESQRDINTQLDQIATFAAQGFDAIIINTVDPAFTEAQISAAAGIPVIYVNRMPEERFLEAGKTGFVGSDETTSGAFQAEFLSGHFAGRGEPIDYVLFLGIIGHPATNARTQSFRDGMSEAGFTLNNVFEQTANFDRAEAMDLMQQFLGTGINFDAVIANNDEMAIGAFEAMRAVGIEGIPVLGIDATPHAIASIVAGEMAASVFQNPVGQGAGAIDMAIAAASGANFDTITWVPFELVTPDNVADYQ